jgi:hypothetical protein
LESLVALQTRCCTIFPKETKEAFEHVKSLEKILDFQSDMISKNTNLLKTIQKKTANPENEELSLGKQRLLALKSKTLDLINIYHLDFAGHHE